MMYLIVTALAQRHQIVLIVPASPGNRKYVMNLLDGSKSSFRETHFAERVSSNISVADALPRSSVFPVDVGGALISVVAVALCLLMLRAVLSALNGKS